MADPALIEPCNYGVLYTGEMMKFDEMKVFYVRSGSFIVSTVDWKMSHYNIISLTLIDIIIFRSAADEVLDS